MERKKCVRWVRIIAVLVVFSYFPETPGKVEGADKPFIEGADTAYVDVDFRPGAANPVKNPARFYLRRDDILCTLFGKPGNNTLTRNWDKATSADLTDWASDTSTVLNEPNYGNGLNGGAISPTALAMGRINGPEKDDVVGAFYYIDGKKVKPYVFFVDHPEINTKATDAFSTIGFEDETFFDDYWCIDIAVGDLDRKLNENGEYNDEIVLLFRFSNSAVSRNIYLVVLDKDLNLIDYKSESQGLDHPRDYNGHTHAFMSVTAGDYDNDGACEIATGFRYEHADSWNQKFLISTWQLQSEGDGIWYLQPMDDYTYMPTDDAPTSWPYNMVDMTSGDFNGDGTDEFAVAVSSFQRAGETQDLLAKSPWLTIFTTGKNLEIEEKGSWNVNEPQYYGTVRGASITSGLFKYNGADFTTARRQIAMSGIYNEGSNNYWPNLMTFQVDDDFNPSPARCFLSISTYNYSNDTTCIPKITAGNFKGIDSETITEQVAISWVENKQPKFGVFDLDNSLKPYFKYKGDFNPGHPDTCTCQWSSASIVAADRDGKGYYLGSPIHLEIPSFIRANYVVQEPPKHLDYIPVYDSGTRKWLWKLVRVSRDRKFYASFEYGTDKTLETKHTDTTNFDIGGSEQVSAKETVGDDVGCASADVTIKQKEKLAYDYDSVTQKVNGHYQEVTTQAQYNSDRDDYIQALFKVMDIWRYRIYGYETPNKLHGFYEVVMPGPTRENLNTWGLNLSDYYQPLHENGNILSYPQTQEDNEFLPEDLGSFSVNGIPWSRPMSLDTEVTWGSGSGQTSIKWYHEYWSEDTKTHTHKLNFNADFQAGFSAAANLVAEEQKWYANIDVSFHTDKSWSDTSFTENTMSTTDLITLYFPSSGNSDQSYNFKPVVYSTKDGTLKLAHAVDLGTDPGQWWQRYYKGQPDLALNLPRKFHWVSDKKDQNYLGQWYVAADRQSRSRMRRLFLLHNEPKTEDTDRLYVATSPTAGDIIYVLTTVYNYSQDTETGDFKVRFSHAGYNPDLFDQAPNLTTIGEATVDSLDPREHRDVYVKWDTTGLGGEQPGTAKSYVIYVTVDPDNEVPHEIHELYAEDQYCWDFMSDTFFKSDPEPCPTVNGNSGQCGISCASNNQGYWPWDNSFSIFSAQTDEEAQEGAALDVSIELASFDLEPTSESEAHNPYIYNTMPYRLRLNIVAGNADKTFRDVYFYDNDHLFSVKRAYGLNPGNNDFYCEWIPETCGDHRLMVKVLEDRDDPVPGNNTATLDVFVEECGTPLHR